MALLVVIRNISELADVSDYEAEVLVTMTDLKLKVIANGTIKAHRREDGWRKLVQRVVDELPDELA